ncbi:MAG: DUF3089 domain-containing protein [Victivallaceae bacterium]|nr:DUF3089 domain-containing protein [Victivallaceae bacterium]
MSKKINFLFLFLSLLLLALFSGCRSAAPVALDYADRANWAILEETDNTAKADGFDLFYIYPTLASSKNTALMDWNTPAVRDNAMRFIRAQTGIFGGRPRVFVPKVRQLEIGRSMTILQKRDPRHVEETALSSGIADARAALTYYLRNLRGKDRPYILMGHSQGAMNLYQAIKQIPDLSESNGFVAAYLPGLPLVTTQQFAEDFRNRPIAPGKTETDLGVVLIWNTQGSESGNTIFTGPGVCCINPLNWRTDAVPAPASANLGAIFYNRHAKSQKKAFTRAANFCGATVDPAKGALIVDLPVKSKFDSFGRMGLGVFHGFDVWFFAENIRANAEKRVQVWRDAQAQRDMKALRPGAAHSNTVPSLPQSGLEKNTR